MAEVNALDNDSFLKQFKLYAVYIRSRAIAIHTYLS